MPDPIDRRRFTTLGVGVALTASTGFAMSADPPAPPTPEPKRDYEAPKFTPKFAKPLIDLTLARDFVLFAHYDLEMVKKLLAKEPALALACVDWGGGDYETGLGGASHLGNREIAEYLLAHGARIDIFAATMLGHLDVVKGLLTARPNLISTRGPHGIPLLMHAKMGGEGAKGVFEYLQPLAGAAEGKK